MIDNSIVTGVTSVQIEHLQEAIGIGVERPRLSWLVDTPASNWKQAQYEIARCDADGTPIEHTGPVDSSESVLVDWPFAPLHSRERVHLKVRVWGNDGRLSKWSKLLTVEAGLLHTIDWEARWITPAWEEDISQANPAPYLRREFKLGSGIRSARLYITALGVYEAEINGRPVCDHILAPGWTVYDKRLRYQTFDVTELLNEGQNAIGAILGDGWYRGRLGFGGGRRNIYGDKVSLLVQLEVQYADGSSERFVSDESWRAATGAILASDIYDGESYDARLELTGWSKPNFDEINWSTVRTVERDLSILEAPISPPVRRIETLAPVAITQSPSGKTLVDFGQNLVGRCTIQVQGDAGQTVTLRHAEVLEKGELGIRPLRFAKATDQYTLRGGGVETWEPRFTFHGFRYAEIEGWPGELHLEDITAVVLHSDMIRTGWFECSDPMLNQLHKNVVWGMRGNFLDVPTDCPQRDERLGWTGDIQVFSPTATFLYDVGGFLYSWLADLAIEQEKSGGSVPHVVPDILGDHGAAAWGDAAVIVPWVLYQRYGDRAILETQFESMSAWVDYVAKAAGDSFLWDTGFQFGDWLDPTAPPDKPWQARTDKSIIASAYFAYSANLVAHSAAVLGYDDKQNQYAALAANAKKAFAEQYITPAGRLMNDTETAYALAIMFDLLPMDKQKQRAGERLAELVRDSGYHIRTGFVGTPLICDALHRTGQTSVAYRLLLQDSCPSWLYPVTMGATTVWERWDSMLMDGSINPGEMTSFNHYALGAVADWMHRIVGGIALAEPGYKRLAIAPLPGGSLTQCRTKLDTPYGTAVCHWRINDGTLEMDVTIPPNATARVTLPGSDAAPFEVGSGEWHWSVKVKVNNLDTHGTYSVDNLAGDLIGVKRF